MLLPENTPFRPYRPDSEGVEFIGQLSFQSVTARFGTRFGHGYSAEKKAGEFPEQIGVRSISLDLERPDEGRYHNRVCVGGSLDAGGFSVTGGGDLYELCGHCTIYPKTEDADQKFAVGALVYLGEISASEDSLFAKIPASYSLEVHIPRILFDDVADNIKRGKLPLLSIQVRDLGLPNEFELHWDTKLNRSLPVIAFEATFVTAVDTQRNKDREFFRKANEELYFPPTKSDIQMILSVLHAQAERIGQLAEQLRWILYGLAPIVGYCVWRLIFH